MRFKRWTKVIVACSLALGMLASASLAGLNLKLTAEATTTDPYQERFMELWEEIHDPANGYFSSHGIPYHSIETLIVEAPDYGHVTTSEALSYYMWLEAMYGRFTGDFSSFKKAWDVTEKYMIPSAADQPNASMSRYTPNSPATYAGEYELPSLYPSQLDSGAAVGRDPIYNELVSTYGTSTLYGMHWLLDVDNWYGYGSRGDGTTSPSFINTFQRGVQESVWETIPQPSWDAMKFGGPNGYLDLFTGDSSYATQFKYTNAPDADARAVQATYRANQWAQEVGVDLSTYVGKATKMGDYLRYSMFDKYFRQIGNSSAAGNGYDAAHYLLSWYYAWGGGVSSDWAWIIGCSHNHFGYQNPMAAWILSTDNAFKPRSANGARDWATSLTRQLEFYQWLQSAEGAIAGGASNSYKGRYENWPAGTSTFYGMGYVENPVYEDPGSNTWFGFQAWSMQRVAELYYETGDQRAKKLLDKWVDWVKQVVLLHPDGSFDIPGTIDWSGQPDTWNGTYTGNPNLHVTVVNYGKDLGIAGSLANTLLYYSKASGDDDSRLLAKELLDRMWNLYRTDKGIAVPEARGDYGRFLQEVYVPSGWRGTMPNGDEIKKGVTFLDIRSKYKTDPGYQTLMTALNNNEDPVFTYHRFWAQADIALAYGLYSLLFGDSSDPILSASISPTSAGFDMDAPADVVVTMTTNGNSFVGVKDGGNTLSAGTDYTVNGDTVTILSSYLATKSKGTLSLTFDFDNGTDPVLVITITDSAVPAGDLTVQLHSGAHQAHTNGISPKFKLINTGTTDINLADLTLRYYYTIDGAVGQSFWCDYSNVDSSNVLGNFVAVSPAKTGADYYLEVSFSSGAGKLAAGQSIEVQTRFSKADWSNYDQSNDYSFTANPHYEDWNNVTAYLSGSLIWGVEP